MLKKINPIMKNRENLQAAGFFYEWRKNGFDYKVDPVRVKEFILSPEYLSLEQSIRPKVLGDLEELFCDRDSIAYYPYEEAVFDEAIEKSRKVKVSKFYLSGVG